MGSPIKGLGRTWSARAHLTGADDPLVKDSPLSKMVGNWREFLTLTDEEELNLLKRHERSGVVSPGS